VAENHEPTHEPDDRNEHDIDEGVTTTVTHRSHRPDPVALVVGLLSLAMAVFAFVGQVPDLSGLDPRWLLAAGAAVVGLMLLVGSLRGRRSGQQD
jgi:uncharacterized membrane protein HdeD (DUF308 family)